MEREGINWGLLAAIGGSVIVWALALWGIVELIQWST